MALCDIGCGYGETARLLASRYAVSVEGVTISESQARLAAERRAPGVSIALCDWLQNGFADARFDRAYAIESSEHIGDKQRFFAEAFWVLRPGGRLVVCAWIAKTAASRWERRFLLEPICRQGRLPGMGTEDDYRALAGGARLRYARGRGHQQESMADMAYLHPPVAGAISNRRPLQSLSLRAGSAQQGLRRDAVRNPRGLRDRRHALLRLHFP